MPGERPETATEVERYAREQDGIRKEAEAKERERDEKSAEADHLLHRHHAFASAVALLQVSIALGALAALTRMRAVWIGSIVAGAVGVAFFVWPFVHR